MNAVNADEIAQNTNKHEIAAELKDLKNNLTHLRLKTNVIEKEEYIKLVGKCLRNQENLEELLK
ncbi:MAG: hypothetical protein AABY22_15310 [Nanoarchaeota archaeon]